MQFVVFHALFILLFPNGPALSGSGVAPGMMEREPWARWAGALSLCPRQLAATINPLKTIRMPSLARVGGGNAEPVCAPVVGQARPGAWTRAPKKQGYLASV